MATFNSTHSGYMTGTAALSNAHGSPQMVTTATEPLHTSSINRKRLRPQVKDPPRYHQWRVSEQVRGRGVF